MESYFRILAHHSIKNGLTYAQMQSLSRKMQKMSDEGQKAFLAKFFALTDDDFKLDLCDICVLAFETKDAKRFYSSFVDLDDTERSIVVRILKEKHI